MNLQPLFDHVIIEREPSMGKTKGGIYIPDAAKQKRAKGTIVACGPGKLDNLATAKQAERMPVCPGQKVLFSNYAGTDIEVNDKHYVVVRADEILAIIHEKKKGAK